MSEPYPDGVIEEGPPPLTDADLQWLASVDDEPRAHADDPDTTAAALNLSLDLNLNLGHAALDYAAGGWCVFPLIHAGKRPLTADGFHAATTDPEQVRAWWAKNPTANIGVAIPASAVVVDVDAKAGGLETLRRLEATRGVPDTLTVLTGGGGLHLYFGHPGGDLRQGVGVLGPGIDTRIPGKGYVVVPPSVHPSGRRYEWYDEAVPAAPMPRWMMRELRPTPPRAPAWPRPKATPDARLNGVLSVLGPDGPGWNDRLHWAACRAAEMVRDDGADPADLEHQLLEAAAPWNERERKAALATIRSGMRTVGVPA